MYLEEKKKRYLGREMFNPQRPGDYSGGKDYHLIFAPFKAAYSVSLSYTLTIISKYKVFRLKRSWKDSSTDTSCVVVVQR